MRILGTPKQNHHGLKVRHIFKKAYFVIPFLALLLWGFQPLIAQPKEQRFKRITIDDGLSQSTVAAITQDSVGFLWFGTKDGLNLYDGYSFTAFKHNRADTNSIGGNHIRSLLTDSEGNVWAGTRNGTLNRYSRNEQRFVRYRLPVVANENRPLSSIDALIQDDKGYLWLGTTADGVFKLDPKTGKYQHFFYESGNAGSLPSNEVTCLIYNPKGEIWVGTIRNGIGIIKVADGSIRHLNQTSTPKLPDLDVYSLFLDKTGHTWIGQKLGGFVHIPGKDTLMQVTINPQENNVATFNTFAQADGKYLWISIYGQGVVRLNTETREIEHFINDPYNLSSLSHNDIRAMLIDKTGNLWLGTNGAGLNKLSAFSNFNVYRHIPNNPTSLSSNSVRTIIEDRAGNLYIGSYTGLMVVNRKNNTTKHYTPMPNKGGLANLAVYCLLEDKEGNIWIGFEGGGLQKWNPKTNQYVHYFDVPGDTTTLINNQILSLFIDSKDNFWVGTNSGLSLLNRTTGKFTHYLFTKDFSSGPYVRDIVEGTPGTLWLATEQGLARFDAATRQALYLPNLGDSENLSHPIGINSINKQNDQTYWLATQGNGLYKMEIYAQANGQDQYQFEQMADDAPLNRLTIYGTLTDNKQNLWYSTDEGLYRYNTQTGKHKKFTRSDGLQSNEFNSNAFYKSEIDGRFYFGGIDGLTDFYPEKLVFNTKVPPVVLTGLKIFNKPYSLPQDIAITNNISLNNNQNYLTLEFAALDYTAPEKNEYAYKLSGIDEDWVYAGSKREAAYTNLPPGKYLFQVRASNNDGLWNEGGATLAITIEPSIWDTIWIKLLIAAFIALILYFVFRMRLAGYREQQKLLEEQLKTQSQKLQLEKLKTEYAVTQALIEGQNQEQKRISEDLHDGLGQTLTAASLNLMALETAFHSPNTGKTEEYLANMQLLMNSAIQEVRNISHNLMPYLLAEEGLQAALDEMCHRAMKSSNLKINLQITGQEERIGESNEINLYRIAQEVISNTQKHSGANTLLIRYHVGPDLISWASEDDGIGFDTNYLQSARNTGLGLKNIQVRVQLMKGKLNIITKPGKGVKIEITVPR